MISAARTALIVYVGVRTGYESWLREWSEGVRPSKCVRVVLISVSLAVTSRDWVLVHAASAIDAVIQHLFGSFFLMASHYHRCL